MIETVMLYLLLMGFGNGVEDNPTPPAPTAGGFRVRRGPVGGQ